METPISPLKGTPLSPASTPVIALIVASTRTTRFADHPLGWAREQLGLRDDLDLTVIDIRDVALPYYDLPAAPAFAPRQYTSAPERELGERLDAADGYLIITNEFNHGYSAALKNVLDHYFAEFSHKPVAFIGYGGVGGARAIEQLRQVAAELNMVSVRESVHLLGTHFGPIREGGDAARAAFASLEPRLTLMTDHLLWWTRALMAARAADKVVV
jgi:NAD(P)H-dependent FMN reductase